MTFEKVKENVGSTNAVIESRVTEESNEAAYNVHRPYKGKGFKPKERNDNNKPRFVSEELAIPAQRMRNILLEIVHNTRTIILVIPTKVKGQLIVLRKSRMTKKMVDEIALLTTKVMKITSGLDY